MKPSKIVAVILSVFIGLAIIGIGTGYIYANGKTDSFGGGQFEITKCHEIDWAWHIYGCEGSYTAYAGMITVHNVGVKLRAEYKAGDRVGDIYPTSYSSRDNQYLPATFVTGFERASVAYNLPWLLLVVGGLFLPIFVITHAVLTRHKHTKHA